MIKRTLLLILCALTMGAYADTEPGFEKTGITLNGVIPVGTHGFLCISTNDEKDHCNLMLVDLDLKEKWNTDLAFQNNKKASKAGDVQILYSANSIYWINEAKGVRTATIDASNGKIIREETLIPDSKELTYSILDFGVSNNELHLIHNNQGALVVHNIEDGQLDADPKLLKTEKYVNDPRQFATVKGNAIYSFSYRIDRNHGKLVLNLSQHDFDGRLIQEKDFDLISANHSFAFNSAFDRNLVTFNKMERSFMFFGKLDYQFKNGYVENPEESGFVGFWVAKIDFDFENWQHDEFLFSVYDKVVPSGVISKQCLIDLREDDYNGVFFNFTLRPGMLDPKSHIFYLNSELEVEQANVGKIPRNFFDYNPHGVRYIAKSNNIRIPDDLMRYQSACFLTYVNLDTDVHGPSLEALQHLNRDNKSHPQDKFYATYPLADRMIIIEYLKSDKGTLRFYDMQRSTFKF